MGEAAWGTVLGGIGLFLLGMSMMTDSLTALGGRALRGWIRRMTRNRFLGLLIGAGATAAVQSSSATTLITVGFVSAGMLSFQQSLGVILGANVGTTSTAWIVSTIGLKLDVAAFALPIVGVGALVRLFTQGRRARLGMAMAGFGLVFVGIDALQAGMATLEIDLTRFAEGGGVLNVLALAGVGALMTVVMQSSSAAVATTLAAMYAGTLNLEQGAVLAIGQNIGTTVTAILGALGGSTAAKRAATAHTMFNLLAGGVAILVMKPLLAGVEAAGQWLGDPTPEVMLAIFHTAFNLLGVGIMLPLLAPFARLVERLVPERGAEALQGLTDSALQMPALALEASRRATVALTSDALFELGESLKAVAVPPQKPERLLHLAAGVIRNPRGALRGRDAKAIDAAERLRRLDAELERVREYVMRVRASQGRTEHHAEQVEVLHALSRLQRLLGAAADPAGLERLHKTPMLRALTHEVADQLQSASAELEPVVQDAPEGGDPGVLQRLEQLDAELERMRAEHRTKTLGDAVKGEIDPGEADEILEAGRWLRRLTLHAWRAVSHLSSPSGTPETASASELDPDFD
jgi:phosphate:Na+ symporter